MAEIRPSGGVSPQQKVQVQFEFDPCDPAQVKMAEQLFSQPLKLDQLKLSKPSTAPAPNDGVMVELRCDPTEQSCIDMANQLFKPKP